MTPELAAELIAGAGDADEKEPRSATEKFVETFDVEPAGAAIQKLNLLHTFL